MPGLDRQVEVVVLITLFIFFYPYPDFHPEGIVAYRVTMKYYFTGLNFRRTKLVEF